MTERQQRSAERGVVAARLGRTVSALGALAFCLWRLEPLRRFEGLLGRSTKHAAEEVVAEALEVALFLGIEAMMWMVVPALVVTMAIRGSTRPDWDALAPRLARLSPRSHRFEPIVALAQFAELALLATALLFILDGPLLHSSDFGSRARGPAFAALMILVAGAASDAARRWAAARDARRRARQHQTRDDARAPASTRAETRRRT